MFSFAKSHNSGGVAGVCTVNIYSAICLPVLMHHSWMSQTELLTWNITFIIIVGHITGVDGMWTMTSCRILLALQCTDYIGAGLGFSWIGLTCSLFLSSVYIGWLLGRKLHIKQNHAASLQIKCGVFTHSCHQRQFSHRLNKNWNKLQICWP